MTGLLHLLFFCSGFSALVYQVVWVRVLGNIFGNTIYSASVVVAVFMLGLGAGGFAAGGWADLSADGRRAAFTVRDDSGPFRYRQNIVAYDVASQQAQRVTRADSFADSERLRLCPGGECVLFDSHAGNLVPGDGNGGFADVFLATDLFGDSPVPATPASRP